MVNSKLSGKLVLLILIFLTCFPINYNTVEAAEYNINHQHAKVWINRDGTIDLFYDIEILCTGGSISQVEIGQPNEDFVVGWARDENGLELATQDIRNEEYYAVRINLKSSIYSGESARFTLLTNVGHLIWEDEQNPQNVGMQFTPTWWPIRLSILTVSIVMPQGVTTSNVRNSPDWDNAFYNPEEDNKLVLYWERRNFDPDQKLSLGVSFPKEFVDHYEVHDTGIDWYTIGIIALGVAVAGVFLFAIFNFFKQTYVPPALRMETLGIRRGLTAVEASQLLDLPPVKIIAEIIFSLLMKKAIWVKSTEPTLQVEPVKPFKPETSDSLRYYEINFVKALKNDGTLDEVKLAKNLMLLRETVDAKMHGYCRKDTVEYYQKIVAKAWNQVEQAGTPELASKAYNENLLWLLMDRNIKTETDRVFGDKHFTPEPDWWWYWYVFTRNHTRVEIPPPTGDKVPPAIPGADLADKIATSIENTANKIVGDLEKFANSILPASSTLPKSSRQPARGGVSCVCACASCACVCACVSCACACASGGAR